MGGNRVGTYQAEEERLEGLRWRGRLILAGSLLIVRLVLGSLAFAMRSGILPGGDSLAWLAGEAAPEPSNGLTRKAASPSPRTT